MVKPLTTGQAKSLKYGQWIYIIGWYNADGSPQHCKVTGKVQTWKTRPNEFRVPVKRGLYETGEITHNSMEGFSLERPESIPKNEVYKGRRRK